MAATSFHIVMFPWFAMDHLTPYLQLSNKLAEKGHKISFLIPTKTLSKVQKLNLHPKFITFVPLVVPHVEGMALGAETMSDVPIPMLPLLATAFDLLEYEVDTTLKNLKPHFVFFDFAHWIPKIGSRLGFKSIFYAVLSASTFAFRVLTLQPKEDQVFTVSDVMHPPPDYPHPSTMELSIHKAFPILFMYKKFGNGLSLRERLGMSMNDSDAISLRSCREIEGPYCDYMEVHYRKKLLLTGPVLPEQTNSPLEERWEKWLDGFKQGSVVYCAFGSECVLKNGQLQELVIGLEQSGSPFLVVLKPPIGAETVEAALPDGFQERVKGRGVVHEGWVQQQQILKHPSVGCFVSHCGFGSMWESLVSNCQIVLVPNIADQFLNTRVLSRVLKVATAVERREEDGWFTGVDISKAVKLVMSDGPVANEVKQNHAKLKNILTAERFESRYLDDDFNQELHQLLQ